MATLSSKLVLSLVDQVTGPARGIAGTIKRLNDAQRRNTAQMRAMQTQMLGAVGAGYALARAISSPVKSAIEFESAMADVRKVVDFDTPQAFKEMGRDIIDLSTRLPMAASGIAEIVAAAGQAGMQGNELMAFAQMAAKVGVAFDMTAGATGSALAEIKTQLRLTVPETSLLADAINHLSNTSASSAPKLIDYMKTVASVGKQAGFSSEQTLAIGSAMIAAGAQSNVAATSFRNVVKALSKGASATKRQKAAYKDLGLEQIKVAKAMQKDAVGTLNLVLDKIRALPKFQQQAIISDLFGDEARAIMPLIENVDLLEDALTSVDEQSKYFLSSQKEYKTRAATTANAMQLFKNQATAASIAIGEALLPAVNSTMKAFSPYLNMMTKLAREHPEVTRVIVATTAGLVALRIAAIAARFSFLWMKGGFISAAIAGLRGIGLAARFAATSIKSAKAAAAGAIVLNAVGGGGAFAASLTAALAPMATFKAAAIAVGSAIASITWPIWAALAAVAALGAGIVHYWEPIANFVTGFAGEIASQISGLVSTLWQSGAEITAAIGSWAFDEAISLAESLGLDGNSVRAAVNDALSVVIGFKNQVVSVVSGIAGEIGSWFTNIFTVKDYSAVAEAEFRSAGEKMAAAMIAVVRSIPGKIIDLFRGLGSKIAAVIGSINWSALVPSWARRFIGGGSPAASSPGVDGARATGGNVRKGRTYLLGERGRELMTADRDGYVHNNRDTEEMLEGAPGGATAPQGQPQQAATTVNLGDVIVNVESPQGMDEISVQVAEELGEKIKDAISGIQSDLEWT